MYNVENRKCTTLSPLCMSRSLVTSVGATGRPEAPTMKTSGLTASNRMWAELEPEKRI